MHVLIATDGTMDVEKASKFGTALAGPNGRVTVLTIIEVHRNLLRDLRAIYGERHPPRIDQDAEYVSVRSTDTSPDAGWPGDDEMIARYLDQQREARTETLVAELSETGVEVEVVALEGENAASGIIAVAKDLGAEVVVLGSHGSGLFEGLLGSTGTKLARRAPCPVLVLREG